MIHAVFWNCYSKHASKEVLYFPSRCFSSLFVFAREFQYSRFRFIARWLWIPFPLEFTCCHDAWVGLLISDPMNGCVCPPTVDRKRVFVPIEGIRHSSNIKIKHLLSLNILNTVIFTFPPRFNSSLATPDWCGRLGFQIRGWSSGYWGHLSLVVYSMYFRCLSAIIDILLIDLQSSLPPRVPAQPLMFCCRFKAAACVFVSHLILSCFAL